MRRTIHVLVFITLCVSVAIVSCVKDDSPPDCIKPAKPTAPASLNVPNGDTIHLTANATAGARFTWTGPNGFYSTAQNPAIPNANIANNGNYWVKILAGNCISDSVATNVFVKSDTTCSLGTNAGNFPNGSQGPFSMSTTCSTGLNGRYELISVNADSTVLVDVVMNHKPTSGGKYVLTDNNNPSSNEIYYQVRGSQGGFFYAKGSPAYVKYTNGLVNIVICQVPFPNLGVFSANLGCH